MSATMTLLNLAGAIALLLWSVRMVRTGVTRALAGQLHNMIARATPNRVVAGLNGMAATIVVQSSVAVAMIVASLAGRGAMSTVAGLAVLLGADVGSTMVVQILAFDVSWLSPLAILVGVISFKSAEGGIRRHLGRFSIGIGLLLLSLGLIKAASAPLRGAEGLIALLHGIAGDPLLACLMAIVLTWIAHSSLAVILLVISLAAESVLGIEGAAAMVLGANIGSSLVPVIASLKAAPPARRVPVGNLLMRGSMALLGLALIPEVLAGLSALAGIGGDVARLLAAFHTAFNLIVLLAFMPLLGPVARMIERVLPEAIDPADPARPIHLDTDLVDDPPTALAAASREALRMADTAEVVLRQSLDFLMSGDDRLLPQMATGERVLDRLHRAIKLYLIRVHREGLDDRDARRQMEIMALVTNLEHFGDIIDHNLIEAGRKRARAHLHFSASEAREIRDLHELVERDLKLAAGVFMTRDVAMARKLVARKSVLRDVERRAAEDQLARLSERDSAAANLHLDVIRDLKRLHSHIAAIAYPLLEAEGELARTRLVETAYEVRMQE
ncbi:MAG: Na/Pi cotransporter family protein [Geminicoccaceae bacterium]